MTPILSDIRRLQAEAAVAAETATLYMVAIDSAYEDDVDHFKRYACRWQNRAADLHRRIVSFRQDYERLVAYDRRALRNVMTFA